ncbi:MAG: hypothetical protein LBQ45_01095 [Mycoplasmataceae bacterium]|jgi:hypothetical protein|nr:hypothetical protein [Mycoplasmataceae bacterium]
MSKYGVEILKREGKNKLVVEADRIKTSGLGKMTLDKLSKIVIKGFDGVNKRIDKLEDRIVNLEDRFDNLVTKNKLKE